MNEYITNYVEKDVDPSNESHDGTFNSLNGEDVNEAIDQYQQNLKIKLEKSEILRAKILKSNFPDDFREYIIKLYDANRDKLYDIMNNLCDAKPDNRNRIKTHQWDYRNTHLTYCYKDCVAYNSGYSEPILKLCDSCDNILKLIKEQQLELEALRRKYFDKKID